MKPSLFETVQAVMTCTSPGPLILMLLVGAVIGAVGTLYYLSQAAKADEEHDSDDGPEKPA